MLSEYYDNGKGTGCVTYCFEAITLHARGASGLISTNFKRINKICIGLAPI